MDKTPLAKRQAVHLPAEIVFSVISDLVAEYLHVIFTKGQPTWDTAGRDQVFSAQGSTQTQPRTERLEGEEKNVEQRDVVPWNAILTLLGISRQWGDVTSGLLVTLFCDPEELQERYAYLSRTLRVEIDLTRRIDQISS
jgi:hypothetical protein